MSSSSTIEGRIRAVFGRVFQAPPESVSPETRRGELERWDSLGHLSLIEALRNEFRVEIPPEQALEMDSVADVQRVMTELVQDGSQA